MSQNNWGGQDQDDSEQQRNPSPANQRGDNQRRNENWREGSNDQTQQQRNYNNQDQQQGNYDDPNRQSGFDENYSQDGSSQRNDGYADTQGRDDDFSQYGQPAGNTPVQQSSDPNRSGVQPARNQPGRRVDSPGRDTGTSWGEDEQMGYTTDTPDRSNPAN